MINIIIRNNFKGRDPLDFRQLQYASAIARHQSLSLAAEELGVTQPTLTKFLQQQEEEMGFPLFQRIGKRFFLTYPGERYLDYAARMLQLKKEMDHELSDINQMQKGRLSIAYPIIRSSYMIPATLPAFHRQYPGVEVILYEEPSTVLEELLISGKADIAIFNQPIKNPHLDYEILRREEIALAVAKTHPLAQKGRWRSECRFPWIDLKRFENEPFIIHLPDQRTGQIARQLFEQYKMSPPIALQTRSIEGAVRLAASGFGLCFVSESHLKYIYTQNQPVYFSIGEPSTKIELVVAYRKGGYLPQYAQDYIQIVRSCVT